MDWRIKSRCSKLTPEQYDKLFFPKAGRSLERAKKFCEPCPVNRECLEAALNMNARGIWAGTNKTERDKILRTRNGPSFKPTVVKKRKKRIFKTAA